MAVTRAVTRASLWQLSAQTYARHDLHVQPRAWTEANCYVDLCIELLHAAKLEPMACLGVALASGFEGDQFTFLKPSFGDLEALYGVEIVELNIWRSVLEHTLVQLQRGRMLLVEVDAFYLPDVAGTDYQCSHTKTTIGIETIDTEHKQLGYFHNAGYFTLQAADFDGLFAAAQAPLAPYVELVRFERARALPLPQLAACSLELARKHLRKRPARNPISEYKAQFAEDLAWLLTVELPTYHLYAFSVLRQLGAAFELAALHLRWLGAHTQLDLAVAASEFDAISSQAKSAILKLARAVNAKRPVDLSAMLQAMETSWERGMDAAVAGLKP